MLSQPAAVPLVATIVHEATHQIAFNCGLQTRLADIPLWLCEGMAVYFEAPDLTEQPRLARHRPRELPAARNVPPQPAELATRLARRHCSSTTAASATRSTAVAAYADAWALNYYLIKYRPHEYAAYLKTARRKATAQSKTRPKPASPNSANTLRRPESSSRTS